MLYVSVLLFSAHMTQTIERTCVLDSELKLSPFFTHEGMNVLKDEKKYKLARYIKDWTRLFPSRDERYYWEKRYFNRNTKRTLPHNEQTIFL